MFSSPSIPQLHPSLSLPAANPLVFSKFSSFLFYLSPFLWSLFENSYHFKSSTEDPRPHSSPLRVVLHWHRWIEHSTLSKIVPQTYAVVNRKCMFPGSLRVSNRGIMEIKYLLHSWCIFLYYHLQPLIENVGWFCLPDFI